jgi:hypothetical protein
VSIARKTDGLHDPGLVLWTGVEQRGNEHVASQASDQIEMYLHARSSGAADRRVAAACATLAAILGCSSGGSLMRT